MSTRDESITWIENLCDTTRELCSQPWTLELESEPWTVASNGRVLAMTRGDFGYRRCPNPSSYLNVLAGLPKRDPVPLSLEMLRAVLPPVLLPDCEECDNWGTVDCPDCDGDGWKDCECRACGDEHTVRCDRCKGKGDLACTCGRKPEDAIVPIRIGIGVFNLRLLEPVLPHLPDASATWAQDDDPRKAAMLTTGRWRIVFMPLSDPDQDVRHVIPIGDALAGVR